MTKQKDERNPSTQKKVFKNDILLKKFKSAHTLNLSLSHRVSYKSIRWAKSIEPKKSFNNEAFVEKFKSAHTFNLYLSHRASDKSIRWTKSVDAEKSFKKYVI